MGPLTGGLTILAVPKAFEGHFGLIQRNAARSWARLAPKPEIILFGADAGTAEMAAEIGARHVPDIATSPAGAPMLDDLLRRGQQLATRQVVCFVNADIVLTPAWMRAVEQAAAWRSRFLMVGRRWNFDLLEPLDFATPGWAEELVARAQRDGKQATNMFIDYFVFPRGLLTEIPPFVIGRPGYDNWLLWRTRQQGIALIDASVAAPVVHQNHDYAHIKANRGDPGGKQTYLKGEDTRRNGELAGDWTHFYTTDHATHMITGEGIRPAFARRYLEARVDLVKRHVINVTRPLRRKVGLDFQVWKRLRAWTTGGPRSS
jgi:hypothetical protein